jgi:hypothetical protein
MSSITQTSENLTLAGAKIAIAAAEDKAREMGLGMNIAVVDASVWLSMFCFISSSFPLIIINKTNQVGSWQLETFSSPTPFYDCR